MNALVCVWRGRTKRHQLHTSRMIYLETIRFCCVHLLNASSKCQPNNCPLGFHSRVPPVTAACLVGHTRVRERENAAVLLDANGTEPFPSATESCIVLEFCSGMPYNYSVLSHRPPLRLVIIVFLPIVCPAGGAAALCGERRDALP